MVPARTEFVTRGEVQPLGELAPGVVVQLLAGGSLGASGLTTCLASLAAGASLPYHTHPTGEAITAIGGQARVGVQGRCYSLRPYDAIYVPAGVAHKVANTDGEKTLLHTSFPCDQPERAYVEDTFEEVEQAATDGSVPEHLVRLEDAPRSTIAPGVVACDLFAKRLGSPGMCGGHGLFQPGTELPCHVHHYDESITIVQGQATCEVAGRQIELAGRDTACIPRGRPHRFLNRGKERMVMIWVYAGDEPERTPVAGGFCSGTLPLSQLAAEE